MSKHYIGLDLSLAATGYVVLADTRIIERGTIKTTPAEPLVIRLHVIASTIVNLLQRHLPDAVAKEAPAFGAVEYGAHDIGQLHGVVAYAIHLAGRNQPFAVAPATLKKFATGHGRAEKSDVKMAIFKRWGEELKDNNVADAYVLARMAGAVEGGLTIETNEQRDCVKTVKKSLERATVAA